MLTLGIGHSTIILYIIIDMQDLTIPKVAPFLDVSPVYAPRRSWTDPEL